MQLLTEYLPSWGAHLVVGLLIVARMGLGALVLARLRLSPLWVFALLVPLVEVVAIWWFAYARWPAEGKERPAAP